MPERSVDRCRAVARGHYGAPCVAPLGRSAQQVSVLRGGGVQGCPPPPPTWTPSVCFWMHPVNGTGNSPSPGRPTPGVVKQDKSSRGSVDKTKTCSDPRRVRMSSGERPIGAAKGKQTDTEALCHPPPLPERCRVVKRSPGRQVQCTRGVAFVPVVKDRPAPHMDPSGSEFFDGANRVPEKWEGRG